MCSMFIDVLVTAPLCIFSHAWIQFSPLSLQTKAWTHVINQKKLTTTTTTTTTEQLLLRATSPSYLLDPATQTPRSKPIVIVHSTLYVISASRTLHHGVTAMEHTLTSCLPCLPLKSSFLGIPQKPAWDCLLGQTHILFASQP